MALFLTLLLFILFGLSTTLAHPHSHHRPSEGDSTNQGAPRYHDLCTEPTNLRQRLDELHADYLRGHIHETFYMLPRLRDLAWNQTRQFSFLSRRSRASGETLVCPAMDNDEFQGDPCPTYTTVNFDLDRYPRRLKESRCRCNRCRGMDTSGDMIPTCEGVFHLVRVLRKTAQCMGGVFQYEATWDKIQTGCACKLQTW